MECVTPRCRTGLRSRPTLRGLGKRPLRTLTATCRGRRLRGGAVRREEGGPEDVGRSIPAVPEIPEDMGRSVAASRRSRKTWEGPSQTFRAPQKAWVGPFQTFRRPRYGRDAPSRPCRRSRDAREGPFRAFPAGTLRRGWLQIPVGRRFSASASSGLGAPPSKAPGHFGVFLAWRRLAANSSRAH